MINEVCLDTNIPAQLKPKIVHMIKKAYSIGKRSGKKSGIGFGRKLERNNRE